MQRVDYVILGAVALLLIVGSLIFLPSGPSEYNLNNAYASGCNELKVKYSCDQYAVTKITTLTTGGSAYSLGSICATKGYDNTLSCARSCGCKVNGTGISITSAPRIVYSDNPVIDGVVGDPAEEVVEEAPQGDEYYGI